MSTQTTNITIRTPEFQSKSELFILPGYRCPVCNGRGSFTNETGHDQYKEDPCSYCKGARKVKAVVSIKWEPDNK
ncbi:MAG: hypothetical protein LBV72_10130 [Tannerella sp.]|jgi:DnaJ-class molecular chaperone|nr:hypothetical protein [Tannerella sp.]